jgi:YgiT-type zinc finger domain-containing protein
MTRTEENNALCAFCGTPGVQTLHKTKLFGKGANTVIIENVPVQHCRTCGESYYDPDTSHLIDDILAQPERYTVQRPMNVASLAA